MLTNDRLQGILSFNIKNPYKITVDGDFEDRTEIICHEFNNKASANTAWDLEQLLLSAFSSIERKAEKMTKKQIQKEEKEENLFYENNSPSEKEVAERSDQLLLMFKMQKEVKMSELMDLFEDMVAEKLLSTAGDVKMFAPVWDSIKPKDKLDIVFRYIVFFVNPLQSLQQMAIADSEGNTK